MQDRTYGELIDLIQSLIGAGTMTGDEYLKISNFINRRYSEAYNTSPSWFRYLVSSEERNLFSLVASGATGTNSHANQNYFILGQDSSGSNVYRSDNTHSSDYYIFHYIAADSKWRLSLVASSNLSVSADNVVSFSSLTDLANGDQTNVGSPADVKTWTNTAELSGTLSVKSQSLLPWAPTDETNVGEFIRIHRTRSFFTNSSIEYDFFVDSNGANILNPLSPDGGKAFATYKKRLELFTVAVSDPPVAADFVDGGTTNGAANRALAVPLEFFYYLAHSVFADFLRLESKYADARTEEGIAQTYLAQELEKIDIRSNNNSINRKFSTYVNRQSR